MHAVVARREGQGACAPGGTVQGRHFDGQKRIKQTYISLKRSRPKYSKGVEMLTK